MCKTLIDVLLEAKAWINSCEGIGIINRIIVAAVYCVCGFYFCFCGEVSNEVPEEVPNNQLRDVEKLEEGLLYRQ